MGPSSAESGPQRRRITFSGRVQGVGFRATARHIASQFPVAGWVRNDPEGTVTMEVEGTPAAVEGYLVTLRERMGRLITAEDSTILPVENAPLGFTIRR